MSTRCNVIVKDKFDKIWLYHHHDGYVEGVGADLVSRFAEKFQKDERIWWSDIVNTLVKDQNDEYEITDGEHSDIEYCYTIDCEKKTICWQKVDTDWNSPDLPHTYGRKNYLIKEGKLFYKTDEANRVKTCSENVTNLNKKAEIKMALTVGFLVAGAVESSIREYCFANDYKLELEKHSAGLEKVFLIKIVLPANKMSEAMNELKQMFN